MSTQSNPIQNIKFPDHFNELAISLFKEFGETAAGLGLRMDAITSRFDSIGKEENRSIYFRRKEKRSIFVIEYTFPDGTVSIKKRSGENSFGLDLLHAPSKSLRAKEIFAPIFKDVLKTATK